MEHKWIGAGLIILTCGSFGINAALTHTREERMLRQLVGILDYMECELQYHLTPLPDLCQQAAGQAAGVMRTLFAQLARELEAQIAPEVSGCMDTVLGSLEAIPSHTREALQMLGRCLGRFDLSGQIRGLEAVRTDCRRTLDEMEKNRDTRLRSYRTLGFSAGAALAILLI